MRQFVAMPLGQGYTIEAQLTDEETYGGFQLEVFEPKEGRFNEPDYNLDRKIDLIVRISKSNFESRLLQTNRFFRTIVNSIRNGENATDVVEITGLPKEEIIRIYFEFRRNYFDSVEDLIRVKFGDDRDFDTIKGRTLANLNSLGLRDEIDPADEPTSETQEISTPSPMVLRSSPCQPFDKSQVLYSSPSPQQHYEMGIAAGGRLKQQIIQDRYGFDAWDEERSRFVEIHIVNSEMYQAITGLEPLPSPVTQEQYQKSGIPWFSHYDETVKSVNAAGALSKIQGVGEIDKKRGRQQNYQDARRTISPEVIRRIKTPDVNEAATEFRRRAYESAEAGRWKDAIRETNYLIDLGLNVSASDYSLRSHCNYQLDLFFEADVDSGKALEIDPMSVDALVLRSRCRFTLGDHEGANEAAEALVSFRPPNPIGFEVLAESALIRGDFKEAQQNVFLAFTFGLESDRADEIVKLASEALANE